jgi:hypothetical protein
VLRLFDKPGITHNGVAANVGVQWGIFFALAAAGLLAYSGSRMRAARRPEAPLMRREPAQRHDSAPTPRPAPADARRERRSADEEQTVVVARRERSPYPPAPAERASRPSTPAPDSDSDPARAPTSAPTSTSTSTSTDGLPRDAPLRTAPPPAAGQLSFEDSPPSE